MSLTVPRRQLNISWRSIIYFKKLHDERLLCLFLRISWAVFVRVILSMMPLNLTLSALIAAIFLFTSLLFKDARYVSFI